MILFVIGKDRPGIVDDVSTILFEGGANIEDSRMAVMGGCFSVMILFSCIPEQLEVLKADLKGLEKLGLELSLHRAEDPTDVPRQAMLPLKMEVLAMDHPGIVQKVVHLLRQYDVNIESLTTRIAQAPLSGAPIFNLNLEMGVPSEKSIVEVKEALDRLAADMNLDLRY
jgi:glycine cleavage system transcriptional repressor